jgi:hypothetical protein
MQCLINSSVCVKNGEKDPESSQTSPCKAATCIQNQQKAFSPNTAALVLSQKLHACPGHIASKDDKSKSLRVVSSP